MVSIAICSMPRAQLLTWQALHSKLWQPRESFRPVPTGQTDTKIRLSNHQCLQTASSRSGICVALRVLYSSLLCFTNSFCCTWISCFTLQKFANCEAKELRSDIVAVKHELHFELCLNFACVRQTAMHSDLIFQPNLKLEYYLCLTANFVIAYCVAISAIRSNSWNQLWSCWQLRLQTWMWLLVWYI